MLIYGVVVGSVLVYFFWYRWHARGSMHRMFKENFIELGTLIEKLPLLTEQEQDSLLAHFWLVGIIFDSHLLPEYLDAHLPEIVRTAPAWEVRRLQLQELVEEHKISEQHTAVLSQMKAFLLAMETHGWPGTFSHEKDTFHEGKHTVPLYYETIKEFMMMIEGRNEG